jgi:outer membrane lipoprotein-sorting protein
MKKTILAGAAILSLAVLGGCNTANNTQEAAANNMEAISDNMDAMADNTTVENGKEALENKADAMDEAADNATDGNLAVANAQAKNAM